MEDFLDVFALNQSCNCLRCKPILKAEPELFRKETKIDLKNNSFEQCMKEMRKIRKTEIVEEDEDE